MRNIFIALFLLAGISAPLLAGQKYNPFTSRWETVPDDWEVKYNPFEGDWSYQPQDAKVEYNPFEGSWEWDSGHNE